MRLLTSQASFLGSVFLGATLVLSGCGASNKKPESPRPAAFDDLEDEEPAQAKAPPPPEDVVANAALPFSGYRPADDKKFSDESLLTHLAAADAICVGERHDQVLDHYAQLRILDGIAERRSLRGFELGLAMEMVRSVEQPTLEAYETGRISPEDFEELSGWRSEWGYPIQYYRPQMELARHAHVPLLALGVPRELTREVAKAGISGLTEEQRSKLAEIDSADQAHRGLFDSLMAEHPMEDSKADNYYQAQLVWDEEMAERSARWLKQRAPGRKLIIMAGSAHCHRTAIPARIKRRTGFEVVSVLPVENGSPRPVSSSPSTPEEHLVSGYDYQMVFTR